MHYKVIGYGSLLSHASLRETIMDKKFRLVIVKGYKRIFDFQTRKKSNSDVLNLEKSPGHYFNAVLFEVNDDELRKLSVREAEYNFENVDASDFKTGRKIKNCLVSIDFFVSIDRDKKLPGKKYFMLCRKAAYKIGKEFGELWDKTTYVSNNEVVSDWIKNHKEYDKL